MGEKEKSKKTKRIVEATDTPHYDGPEVDQSAFSIRARVGQIGQSVSGLISRALKKISGPTDDETERDAVFVHGLDEAEKDLESIGELDVRKEHKEKLRTMLSPQSYDRAVTAAREVGAKGELPTLGRIVAQLKTFTPEKLRDICEMMEKPTLLIVPANSFEEKIVVMDNYSVDTMHAAPYFNAPKLKKSKVSIVDGTLHPRQLEGVSKRMGERSAHLTAKYKAKQMRHIDKDEMATLFQQSLIEAKEKNDKSQVVDNRTFDDDGTATIIDPNSLKKSQAVAFAYYLSNFHRIHFSLTDTTEECDYLRGRATMQLFEF